MGGGEVSSLRTELVGACRNQLTEGPAALLLSGGTDSLTVLWSLLDLGVHPMCYSFYLQGKVHTDVVAAKLACETWGLPLRVVQIPRSSLLEDVKVLIGKFAATRKTLVQCAHPLLHLLPEIAEEQVFTGLTADDWWGSSKSDAIHCARNYTEFQRRRRARLQDVETSGYALWRRIAETYGKHLCVPYRSAEVTSWMLSRTWEQLNRPKQKQAALDAFRAEYSRVAIYRRNCNLQCGSGIREWHETLLSHPCNVNRRTNVVALYKDIAAGVAG